MAYHHNIAVRRKKRLIVLMALDNLNELYANDDSDTAVLRQYLHQYPYIDYPASDVTNTTGLPAGDWVDKLLYAMPLRGLLQVNEYNNHDIELQHSEDRNDDILLQHNQDRDHDIELPVG